MACAFGATTSWSHSARVAAVAQSTSAFGMMLMSPLAVRFTGEETRQPPSLGAMAGVAFTPKAASAIAHEVVASVATAGFEVAAAAFAVSSTLGFAGTGA